MIFPCCGVYGRVYQSPRTGHFEGFCPRCTRKARILRSLLMIFLLLLFLPTSKIHAQELTTTDSTAIIDSLTAPDSTVIDSNVAKDSIITANSIASMDSLPLSDSAIAIPDSTAIAIPDSAAYIPPTAQKDVDSLRFSIWGQLSILFINFDHRDLFEAATDTMHRRFLLSAPDEKSMALVSKQELQKVNFCFPLTLGLEMQLSRGIYLGAGIGYFLNQESAVLIDHLEQAHEVYYALQGVPFTLEMRFWIPPELISLSGHPRFAATVRRWWMLSGTEIYSHWGTIKAESQRWGHGWGFSLGYEIARYKYLRISGELGFSAIQVESSKPWSTVVPVYEEKDDLAKWDLGGIQMQIRGSWGWGQFP